MNENTDMRGFVSMYEACLLHSRADRALRLLVSRQLEQFNVTMMEWLLLGATQGGPKEGMTMSAAASALDVTLPQVTALTASLTKLKLLKQKISRQDRRSRRLITTSAGKKLLAEIEGAVNTAMQEWVADIPPGQLQTYMQTLKLLANRKDDKEL
ncbi:MAG TPA: MarR family transcriptional regulator [Candidatus Limnocylindria bacterium]|nr:MarR family transcriptional regulator [Candidatus Limnocylindria bacterium]